MSDSDLKQLIKSLNFKEKVDRSLALIDSAYREYGDSLIVANSLGKDSMAVWNLAKEISADIRGFIVTTRYKPKETIEFMAAMTELYPELQVYKSDEEIEDELYLTDPNKCCHILKVVPVGRAVQTMNAKCWVTGLRCTEGRTRAKFREIEERDPGLIKLNPILLWTEQEVWQYLALYHVPVNPLYREGYRSLGCLPCSRVISGGSERAGRWFGTSKCGGECGIHTGPLLSINRIDRSCCK